MIPESELVRRTFLLRDMRLPSDIKLTKASLLRWLALSLGLLSEDESRQGIIPVLDSLLHFQLSENRAPTIRDLAERSKLPEKMVRYHMGKLQDTGLVTVDARHYRFVRDTYSNRLDLVRSFDQYYAKKMGSALETTKEALAEIQRQYRALG